MAPGHDPTPVVIVDDDIDHVVIIRRVLVSVAPGAAVSVVSDPARAATELSRAPADALVLLDRRLGAADGIDLLASLHGDRPDLRIALLSATLTADERRRAIEAGAQIAAAKPARLDGWRELLGTLIRGDAATARLAA